ncbi:sigma-54-dependent Fis family transcriptional regulator [Amycolatopsis sacchari]|uniref:sigma-54-dependent Fis family transcriptional regulator n=1 Tax=Amycolatopsis sacchari TaxID=115433 RepID=UPI003D73BC97
MFDNARMEEAKAACLAAPGAAPVWSAELMSSWQRSQAALGSPSNVRDVPHVPEELLDARLLDLFRAPLQRFAETLQGTGLGLLLSDPSGRILESWFSDAVAARHLESVGTLRGAVLSEETVGTNGVGTALVTGHLVQIRGAEHFADFYSRALCTGVPVRHPVTDRILGAVTLSGEIAPRAELLPPLLRTVTAQLQQHILDVEQPASRGAWEMFVRVASTRPDPVVVLGPHGLVMQNAPASRLSREQLAEIQEVSREVRLSTGTARKVRIGDLTVEVSSPEPEVHLVVISGSAGPVRGARLSGGLVLTGRDPEWLAVVHQVEKERASRDAAPLVLAGESGVGKVSLALGAPHVPGRVPAGHVVVDAAESHVIGSRQWLQEAATKIAPGDLVCVRGAETLDRATLAGLRSVFERGTACTAVVTVTTTDQREAEDLAVRLGGSRAIRVPPLRERACDIPDLWHAFARAVAPGAGLVPDAEAVRTLRGHHWPGNLAELRSLVERLATSGRRGPVGTDDLPEALRASGPALSLIEQAEVRAIRQALEEAGGNRAKAAEILGISRATVYRKMKSYHLTA